MEKYATRNNDGKLVIDYDALDMGIRIALEGHIKNWASQIEVAFDADSTPAECIEAVVKFQVDGLELYSDDDEAITVEASTRQWIEALLTSELEAMYADEMNGEIRMIETELEVEVWNSRHEGDVKVPVTIITDTPLGQWTDRDNARLGEFVNENYTEGDENRDVRYTFHLIKHDEPQAGGGGGAGEGTEGEIDLQDVLECLYVRDICKASIYMTQAEATEQHLGMCAAHLSGADAKAAVVAEKAKLERGERYFEAGYRLHYGARQMWGLHITVPADALAYRVVSAGHIATSEAERIEWISKR